jgi:hypothetical protein
MVRGFVFLPPWTSEHLQEYNAKKNVSISRSVVAFSM